jgi:hypothetical protein
VSDRLRIPEELKGPYDHSLIATFGADLGFFEQDLWRSLGEVRNRIVLVDDIMLAKSLEDAAAGQRLRHLNVNYVGAPVTNPNAFHAKLILLTGPDAGLLLVGSGNLGMSGYASQGELFCRYRYEEGKEEDLSAFSSVKEFVDRIRTRGYLDPVVGEHLGRMWADTPWIYSGATARDRPVRHNLDLPLLDQLAEETGDRPVVELVVFAPFYDRRAEALRRLIARLSPKRVTILLQDHETSVDPKALERVLTEHQGRHEVRTASAQVAGTYLHAKLVLVRQRSQSICLQGSPNLSLSALCLPDPRGNIELANLLSGPPDGFDDVLETLVLGKNPVQPSRLSLRYRGDEREEHERFRLVRGTWRDGILTLEASRELPGTRNLRLLLAGEEMKAAITSSGVNGVWIRPNPEAASLLERAMPVALRIREGKATYDSTPIYPYHAEALRLLLAGRRDPELLRRAGGLTVPDEDVARLLESLRPHSWSMALAYGA